jgi:hypothetical protein
MAVKSERREGIGPESLPDVRGILNGPQRAHAGIASQLKVGTPPSGVGHGPLVRFRIEPDHGRGIATLAATDTVHLIAEIAAGS